jgi:hypothetical protein
MEKEEEKKVDNLLLYNAVRKVPDEAKKAIAGGRLKGMTDINPMWRIKTLTENFGMCGIGWVAPVVNKWLEKGSGEQVVANVEIELSVKIDGEWSKPIYGIGGSKFVDKEANGLFTSDEAFKMAYTDAISVACKMLGIGADVYWEKDRTKYDQQQQQQKKAEQQQQPTGINPDDILIAIQDVKDCQSKEELQAIWRQWAAMRSDEKFKAAVVAKGKEFGA